MIFFPKSISFFLNIFLIIRLLLGHYGKSDIYRKKHKKAGRKLIWTRSKYFLYLRMVSYIMILFSIVEIILYMNFYILLYLLYQYLSMPLNKWTNINFNCCTIWHYVGIPWSALPLFYSWKFEMFPLLYWVYKIYPLTALGRIWLHFGFSLWIDSLM